jgi:uroporphyrinogen decarboxylase
MGLLKMSSRQRLLAALNHGEPDRIPIDLGGTTTSTISVSALENLKSHLGIRSKTRLMSSIAMSAYPDDEIIKKKKTLNLKRSFYEKN